MSENCNHRFQKWQSYSEGIYRLYCADCGQYMKSETFLPGTFEIIDTHPPALGISVQDGIGTEDKFGGA